MTPDAINVVSPRERDRLAQNLKGGAWLADDPAYAASVASWDQSVSKRPLLVVVAGSLDDIVTTARWADSRGLPIAIQNTGHGALRADEDSVLISIAKLGAVQVDPDRRRCRVEPGAVWGDVLRLAGAHGLAGLAGGSPGVGVVGYTLGGGLSPIGRTFGFAADRVTSLDVLDADHRASTVTADSDPELYWGLLGSGGLGIVTGLEFELVAAPDIFGGGVFFDGSAALDVVHAYRHWLESLDDRTSTSIALLHLPPVPQLPEVLRGRYVVHLRIAHIDDTASDLAGDGRRILEPMLSFPILLDTVGILRPEQLPVIHMDPVAPTNVTNRGVLIPELTDDAIEIASRHAVSGGADAPRMIEFRHLGGAMNEPIGAPTSTTGRGDGFNLFVSTPTGSDAAATRAHVDGIVEDTAPGIEKAQLNFCGPTPAPGEVLRLWDAEDAARLLAVQERIDPHDRLRTGRPLH